jgi:hypothetical protein
LPRQYRPVARRLVQHEDKVTVFKDILDFGACQQVFDVLGQGCRDAAPFPKPLPYLHGVGGGLFLFQEKMKFVLIEPCRFTFRPVFGHAAPYLIL